jgi:hypothetical protein
MDNDFKSLLEKLHKIVKDNNAMLRKIRGVQKRQAFFQVVHWIFIIGIAIGALYFLQPYIDQFQSFVEEIGSTVQKIKNFMPQ